MIGGRGDFMHVKTHGRVTSHIFVKEPEGSLEKILTYLNCTYVRISGLISLIERYLKFLVDSKLFQGKGT